MTLLAFFIGALVGHRLWRGTLALLLEELDRAVAQADRVLRGEPAEPDPTEPPPWTDHVPVLGPIAAMTVYARLSQLWSPPRPPPPAFPFVGVTCGLALAVLTSRLGPSWPLVGVGPLVVLLIVAAACDLMTGIILDELSGHAFLWTAAYVLLTQAFASLSLLPPPVDPPFTYDATAVRLDTALWGLLITGLPLWLLNLRATITRTMPGLGGGVIKLLLAIALLTGWRGAACTLLGGMLLAVIPAALTLAYASRQPPAPEGEEEPGILFPFTAFVALAALVTLWYGHPALHAAYESVHNRVISLFL